MSCQVAASDRISAASVFWLVSAVRGTYFDFLYFAIEIAPDNHYCKRVIAEGVEVIDIRVETRVDVKRWYVHEANEYHNGAGYGPVELYDDFLERRRTVSRLVQLMSMCCF